jgi:thiamine-monophosphate kinase
MCEPTDEFDWIASLRPLTLGDPRALQLTDDAAVIPARPASIWWFPRTRWSPASTSLSARPRKSIARRLLRTSLSDLAAKGAEPFGYLLMTPGRRNWNGSGGPPSRAVWPKMARRSASRCWAETPSRPPGASHGGRTVLGWVPQGRAIRRSTARADDLLMVCGPIGDGWLGLKAARGEIADPDGALAPRYRLPGASSPAARGPPCLR